MTHPHRPRRAARRAAARKAGVPWQGRPTPGPPAGDLTVAEVHEAERAGHPLPDVQVAMVPAAATPDDLDVARRAAHDHLIDSVDHSGGTRLGPVSWTEHRGTERDEIVEAGDIFDPEVHEALAEWFTENPDGVLVVAHVAGNPPPNRAD